MKRRPLYPVVTVLLLLALTISAMPVRAFAENEAQGEEVAVEQIAGAQEIAEEPASTFPSEGEEVELVESDEALMPDAGELAVAEEPAVVEDPAGSDAVADPEDELLLGGEIVVPDGEETLVWAEEEPLLYLASNEEPTSVNNLVRNAYPRWDTPTTSFLHVNANGNPERVIYSGGQLIVETLSADYHKVISKKVIDASTYQPSDYSGSGLLWGGFFSGGSHNFVVTGQPNTGESESRVVYRVSRYDKEWNFVSSLEFRGENTTYPFDAGSCSFEEVGGQLHIRTSHEMYKSSDGYNHQANVHIIINLSSFTGTANTYVMNRYQTTWGYVSHSFGQRLTSLNGAVYGLDHGDAHPRALAIKRIGSTGDGSVHDVVSFSGDSGENYTGLNIGGFESSASKNTLLSTGAFVGLEGYEIEGYWASKPRNAFVSVTPGGFNSSSSSTMRYLTSYPTSGSTGAGNVKLVKVNENRFLVAWDVVEYKGYYYQSTGKIGYVFVDGNGNPLDSVVTKDAYLSTCDPILDGDKIVWYASDPNDGNRPVYYGIDASSGELTVLSAVPLSEVDISQIAAVTYNGSQHTPKPTLSLNGNALVEGTHYTITGYKNNVNAGTATVTVTATTGQKRVTGTHGITFKVNPVSISSASVTAAGQTYDGSAKRPAPTVKMGNRTLASSTDFTVSSYSGNVNAGTATVKVTGKGNYAGTASGTFTISPADLSKATVTAANQTYSGSAKKPAPTVTLAGKTLTSGTDYTVAYKDNVNAGTATVAVTGKGNYAGKASGTFKINPASLAKATVTAASQTYTGSARKPAPTVVLGDKTLAAADYDVAYSGNVNVGTATVTVTGKGNYKDSASGTFAINKRAISSATIEPIADQPYVGSAVKPKPSLSYGGKALKEGTDYTLAYKDNAGVGTATITITGKGNFKGTTTATFQIVKADLSKATVTAKDQAYDGTAKKTTLTVKFGSLALKEGTDFTVAYKDNVNAGTATVTLTGKGNFTGTKKATFKINPASLAKATVTAKDQTYAGSALRPAPTVTLGGKTLVNGTDYTVAWSSNVNAGTATVTVTGKNNYKDSASGTFKIKPASIAKAAVTTPDQEWDGTRKAPTPTVTLAGRKLTVGKGGDCKVKGYENNVDEGTAAVIVEGQGNYTGTASGTFEIVNAVPVYRLYNRKTSEHLYTVNKGEYDQLPVITKGDWVQEGIAWYAPRKSNTPVYRLYNKKSGDHHYTTSPGERDALVANHGWSSEGIAFYSDDAKRLPLYRVYNHRLKRGQHHYTASIQERDALTSKHGWKDEGIGFYGVRAK